MISPSCSMSAVGKAPAFFQYIFILGLKVKEQFLHGMCHSWSRGKEAMVKPLGSQCLSWKYHVLVLLSFYWMKQITWPSMTSMGWVTERTSKLLRTMIQSTWIIVWTRIENGSGGWKAVPGGWWSGDRWIQFGAHRTLGIFSFSWISFSQGRTCFTPDSSLNWECLVAWNRKATQRIKSNSLQWLILCCLVCLLMIFSNLILFYCGKNA